MVEWAVICEAAGDYAVVTRIADRLAEVEVPWAAGILENLRRWRGLEPAADFTTWPTLKRLCQERGLRVLGHRGRGQEAGARLMVRRVFNLLAVADDLPRSDGVLLVHDRDKLDDDAVWFETWEDLDAVVLFVRAVPIPEIEAWFIVMFDPREEAEVAALASVTKEIGHDPRQVAHTLNPGRTHTQDGQPVLRSTKRILDALMPNEDRERRWERIVAAPFDQMEARGVEVGLAAFVRELRERYLPSLGR